MCANAIPFLLHGRHALLALCLGDLHTLRHQVVRGLGGLRGAGYHDNAVGRVGHVLAFGGDLCVCVCVCVCVWVGGFEGLHREL